jgi:hypothetical protein
MNCPGLTFLLLLCAASIFSTSVNAILLQLNIYTVFRGQRLCDASWKQQYYKYHQSCDRSNDIQTGSGRHTDTGSYPYGSRRGHAFNNRIFAAAYNGTSAQKADAGNYASSYPCLVTGIETIYGYHRKQGGTGAYQGYIPQSGRLFSLAPLKTDYPAQHYRQQDTQHHL